MLSQKVSQFFDVVVPFPCVVVCRLDGDTVLAMPLIVANFIGLCRRQSTFRRSLTASTQSKVRVWAATAICRIAELPPPETLQLLRELLLADTDREFVQNDTPKAIAELGKMAAPLIEHLERAKKHSAAQIRWGLVDAFFALDPPSAVRRALPLMDDKDELVAEIVIKAFSTRGISERVVIDAYIRALGNHDGSFDQPASSAVDALAKLGAAARWALPALEKLALEPEISDTLREGVTRAIVRIR